MLKEERLNAIMDMLIQDGSVQSTALCKKFNVTDVTIRRDLDLLSKKASVIRTHGGAIYNDIGNLKEPSYSSRINSQFSEKEIIASLALEIIQPNQHIFLDSGTTTYQIAKKASEIPGNTYLTNALNIASELITKPQISTIFVGGDLDSNTLATRGIVAENQIKDFRVEIAFLGCNAISPSGDVLVGNITEIGIKQRAMDIARKTYLLADTTKFNKYSLISYARVSSFHGIITDQKPSEDIIRMIEESGASLLFPDSK